MSAPQEDLHGMKAIDYASEHLRELRVDAVAWEIEYIDDSTLEIWVMDFPQSELHGGGPPRLRRKTSGVLTGAFPVGQN